MKLLSVLVLFEATIVSSCYYLFHSTFALSLTTPKNKDLAKYPPVPRTTPDSSTDDSNSRVEILPGAIQRRLFGEKSPPKIALPVPFISALVAAFKSQNPLQALPIVWQTLHHEQQTSSSSKQAQTSVLPIAYKPFSELSIPKDCVALQQQELCKTPLPFLFELTPPKRKSIQTNSPQQQAELELQWLQDNVQRVKEWKLLHGAIFFKSWSLFSTEEGVNQAAKVLGTPCRDPKEIRGPAPLLEGSTTVYETLNNPKDAATHLGLHYEGIPGIAPVSALFSCWRPAATGGEFLLCDGRGVFRDLDAQTLSNLERKKLRPTFAQLPDWIAKTPLPPMLLPQASWYELLALFTDMSKPTDDFFLGIFPEHSDDGTQPHQQQHSLKLTTHAAVPVIHHPVTRIPVWYSGIDAGHQGNFQRDNPHLHTLDGNAAVDAASSNSGGKYASEVFDVRYGNGESISDADLQNVRTACQANTKELAMQPGDAVYLDNFTTLHGRKPFTGARKHIVVWFLD